MENRDDQHRPGGIPSVSLSRAVAVVGILPAAVYGAVVAGVGGAFAGLLLWAGACGLFVLARGRIRDPRAAAATPEAPQAPPDVFDQLTTAPCKSCGTETLLGVCLDCAAIQHRRRVDGPSGDDPDDR